MEKYLIDNKIFKTKKKAREAILAGKVYIGELQCFDLNYCIGETSELTHRKFGDIISIEKKSENHRLIDLIRD